MSSVPESAQVPSHQSPSERRYELFSMLDSEDLKTVEETKLIIQENLFASRDPSLINALVDYYLETRSAVALQLLANVHEARSHFLLEKMNDCLKHSTRALFRLDTLTILGHIVRRQPSWLFKIIKTSLFETFIKCMKSDTDIVLLTTGMSIITTLLPQVPALVGSWLVDFFDIFVRMSSFRSTRTGNVPEVILLHLHVALYLFFHRLYAMYPNNFMAYLKSLSADNHKQALFHSTIKPMLEHVRFHPSLLTESAQSETGKLRWRTKEPHDIVIECLKVSLDPVDRLQEESVVSYASKSLMETLTTLEKSISSGFLTSSEQIETHIEEPVGRLKARRMSDSATQTGKSLQSGDSGVDSNSMPLISAEYFTSGWSPSTFCGLSTPPSSQMSPATSNPDLTSSLTISQGNTIVMKTPGESPTTSLAGDVGFVYPYAVTSKNISKNKKHSKTSSGRATPVDSKVHSNENSLSRALHALAIERQEPTSPSATFGGYHTSTPKATQSSQDGIVSETASKQVENAAEWVDCSSSGVINTTDADTVPIEQNYKDRTKESGSSILVQEEIKVQTIVPSEKVIHQVLVQKEDSCGGEEKDEKTPASVEETRASTDCHASVVSSGDNLSSNERTMKNNLMDHVNVIPCDSTYTSKGVEASTCTDEELVKLDASPLPSRSHSATPTPQSSQHHLLPYSVLLTQNLPFLLSRGDQDGLLAELVSNDTKQASIGPSPLEILDNYLRLGSTVHSQELARVPMVSYFDTEWTHFGGEPPVDELEILRGQVQLLHNQLLYERHKCELHAIRNRRLIGKTFKAVQFQEELLATKDQLGLQEEKMRELTEALVKQTEENRKIKGALTSWDNQQQQQLRELLNENAKLQSSTDELKEKLESENKRKEELKLEAQKCKAEMFVLENELRSLRLELAEKEQLKVQVKELTKHLVVMGQLCQDQKDKIQKLTLAQGQSPENALHVNACQRELAASKHTARKQKAELEAMTSQVLELEAALNRKDIEIEEMKKFIESLKGTHEGKLESMDEKYNALKEINQSLEAHIISLQAAAEVEQRGTREHKDSETSLDGEGTLL